MTMISFPAWVREMAPCLDGKAYSEDARKLVAAALDLDEAADQPTAWLLKVQASHILMQSVLWLHDNPNVDPLPVYRRALDRVMRFLRAGWEARAPIAYTLVAQNPDAVEDRTALHYGTLFPQFSAERYYDEPATLLRDRLERNAFPLDRFPEWRALDAGCGNGRYTLALKKLGMREVVGLDLSELNLTDARARLAVRPMPGVSYEQGSLLKMPFPDGSFDFVFCNGVVHHTIDYDKAVGELLRVLRPGGAGFFYVITEPGGIHWENVDVMRVLLKGIDYGYAQRVLQLLGVPGHRIFLTLDHPMAPVNIRRTRADVATLLERMGAAKVRWLERGCPWDGSERIHRGEPYARAMFGDGENRFYFEKR